jgi:ATP-dependent DNA ligase
LQKRCLGTPASRRCKTISSTGVTTRFEYYAFDLLHLDDYDTRAAPLIEHKRVLQSVLANGRTKP